MGQLSSLSSGEILRQLSSLSSAKSFGQLSSAQLFFSKFATLICRARKI
jgi:hypothetical protein